ncbi:hypothetical protein GGTG_07336 [Gaeumannomyces tritici R3-111a-1]|uniref:Uncharacterized protein n=1 Tax=Gaeumannomyces tritici (strain R3-111a-1) TaxID=644352 RepID=J3P1D9_GAET3|nr:hypothetical protein GGTG_07336 [Gaeumannomyces tritici R3-111a-1]EJT77424.1 hypothetical protein GGTG_07336 [Gaeumannomyces tritici R3-111a-1]
MEVASHHLHPFVSISYHTSTSIVIVRHDPSIFSSKIILPPRQPTNNARPKMKFSASLLASCLAASAMALNTPIEARQRGKTGDGALCNKNKGACSGGVCVDFSGAGSTNEAKCKVKREEIPMIEARDPGPHAPTSAAPNDRVTRGASRGRERGMESREKEVMVIQVHSRPWTPGHSGGADTTDRPIRQSVPPAVDVSGRTRASGI